MFKKLLNHCSYNGLQLFIEVNIVTQLTILFADRYLFVHFYLIIVEHMVVTKIITSDRH